MATQRHIERNQLLQTELSHWQSFTSKTCRRITLAEALRIIRWEDVDRQSDSGEHREATPPQRTLGLSYATISGIFRHRPRQSQLLGHTGLIAVDFENLHLSRTNPAAWKRRAANLLPYLLVATATPSGNGLRLIMAVTPTPTNMAEHNMAFEAMTSTLRHARMDGWSETGRDICSMTPLAHDPWVHIAETPHPLDWQTCSSRQAEETGLLWTPVPGAKAGTIQAETTALQARFTITPSEKRVGRWHAHLQAPGSTRTTIAVDDALEDAIRKCYARAGLRPENEKEDTDSTDN